MAKDLRESSLFYGIFFIQRLTFEFGLDLTLSRCNFKAIS